jgi:predicted component of type VI protein secretion system
MEDIKICFEKYEKRISHIEVLPKPSASRFYLSFTIKCKIENKSCSFQLSFHQQNKSYSLEVDG